MNKERYLKQIAQTILSIQKEGLSKVKFAKTIYFVHKGLVQEGIQNADSLCFIRMPLGPVPVGFKELELNENIQVVDSNIGLSYNQQNFRLSPNAENPNREMINAVKPILEKISGISTSSLVEASHEEPSWKNHKNGDEYCISDEDLNIKLPTVNKADNQKNDNQMLQAHLINGMIDEIVDETTALEYPEE